MGIITRRGQWVWVGCSGVLQQDALRKSDGSCKSTGAECFGFGLIGNTWSVVFWSELAYLRNKGIYEFYDVLLFACSLLHFPLDKDKHRSSAKASVASLPATMDHSMSCITPPPLFLQDIDTDLPDIHHPSLPNSDSAKIVGSLCLSRLRYKDHGSSTKLRNIL